VPALETEAAPLQRGGTANRLGDSERLACQLKARSVEWPGQKSVAFNKQQIAWRCVKRIGIRTRFEQKLLCFSVKRPSVHAALFRRPTKNCIYEVLTIGQ
jgi:hypothetical protein